MPIPDTDLARVRRWCKDETHPDYAHELRVEYDQTRNTVTIVETRPAWNGHGEWTRFPIARLRLSNTTKLWTLYWRDQNLLFHVYNRQGITPTPTIQTLLDHVAHSSDPIFWT